MAMAQAMQWFRDAGIIEPISPRAFEKLDIKAGDVRVDGIVGSDFRFWVPYVEIDPEAVREVAKEFGLRASVCYHYIELKTGRFFGVVATLYRRLPDEEINGFVSAKYARNEELFDALLRRVYKIPKIQDEKSNS
jgi:hypothetical protein